MGATDDIDKQIAEGQEMFYSEESDDPELEQMIKETDQEFLPYQIAAKKIVDDLIEAQSKEVLLFVCSYLRMWDHQMWFGAPEVTNAQPEQLKGDE